MHTPTHTSAIGATRAQAHDAHAADVPTPCAQVANEGAPTIETRLWLPEYDWISSLSKAPENNFPAFRFPDLVSACVAMVSTQDGGVARLFRYLATVQVLRDPRMPRRDTEIWRPQFEQLLALQRSPSNRFPNPRFQLDHLATGCVALIQAGDPKGMSVYSQARQNLKERAEQPSSAFG